MRNRRLTKYNRYCSNVCENNLPLQCHCGEFFSTINWTWSDENDSSCTKFSKDNKEILFHPIYSTGTAAVIGTKPFEQNQHHYWEIKMISNLYGTDVMVGVGTSKVNISEWRFRFCSMLGKDSQSWGYSYAGVLQQKGTKWAYGPEFGVCSIVSVHLDMCNGTLEYYFNRVPLGIAFKGLKGKELYPMVSSTAAHSAIRLICAVSEKPTLQLMCLSKIVKHPILYKQYSDIPGLKNIYDRKYFWVVPATDVDENETCLCEKWADV